MIMKELSVLSYTEISCSLHPNEDKLSASAYIQRGVHVKIVTYVHEKGNDRFFSYNKHTDYGTVLQMEASGVKLEGLPT